MDKEQLELLKRWYKPYLRGNRVDQIANDYGTNVKDIRHRIWRSVKYLVEYYEIKEGLKLAEL